MRIDRRWTIAALAICITLAPLHAQRTSGVTASIGIAYGSLGVNLTDVLGEHFSGGQGATTGSIALGWAFDEQWRAALQFDQVDETNYLVSQTGSGTEIIASFYTASITFYPSRRSNFWVRANVGMGRYESDQNSRTGSAKSLAVGLGLGYDWRFNRTPFAAIPFLSYLAMPNTGNLGGGYEGLGLHGSMALLELGVALGFGN